jgi:release factor glutamine methyltransferase
LAAIRTLIRGAPSHLQPQGWLVLEHGHDQAQTVCELMRQHGFASPATRCDLAGLPRCTGAQLDAAGEHGLGHLPSRSARDAV